MRTVAIYCRVSTLDQSCQLQRDELLRYAKARGWNVYGVFEDQVSGRTTLRPQFQKALGAARRRQIDTLLVWKLDRAFRSLKDMVNILGELKDLGVEFVSLQDNLDMTTSTGKLMAQIIGSFAEYEADMIRERVVAGLAAAKKRGVQLGRPKKVDEAEVIKLRQQGKSCRQIARELNIGLGSVSTALKSNSQSGQLVQ